MKVTNHLKRTLPTFAVHGVNLMSNILGDGWVNRQVRVLLLRLARAELGAGTMFHGGTYFSAPQRLRAGRNCFINRNCYLDLEGPIVLGDGVSIGHGVSILTTYHPIAGPEHRTGKGVGRAVVVGDGAWLGANVTVLPGVTVGRGAVIGAGAVVTTDIPANVLAAGVPAHILRVLGDDTGEEGLTLPPMRRRSLPGQPA